MPKVDYISYLGSKGQSASVLLPRLGSRDVLVAPMVGGGALEVAALEAGLFDRAILADASPYPVRMLRGLQKAPAEVMRWVARTSARLHPQTREHQARCGSKGKCQGGDGPCTVFLDVRRQVSEMVLDVDQCDALTAGCLFGLLRWTFSSLVRQNRQGQLNGAMDPRGTRLCIDGRRAERYHGALRGAEVLQQPWRRTLTEAARLARTGAQVTVFADPPYQGDSTGGFYGGRFSESQASEFAQALARLPCRVVVTEQDPGGAALYSDALGVAPMVYRKGRRRPCGSNEAATARRDVVMVREAL